ncbi:translocation/assembly module TamB domain-containing protein [Rhizomicrobium electricum]|uniref:Translocation and assembly module TamB C-terminal domain-containing protein n=1 Tax=Rhizomicrobium electricum TaxID=480070 RepID=A0ABP3PBY2_9PROT|nr:translocation/assembly module TamB domain-containing protein [Rhizomicrobium electricum]NIJ47829.1 autotransporter translocation and assembly factor TamB [Rhizomicrobium electricum]
MLSQLPTWVKRLWTRRTLVIAGSSVGGLILFVLFCLYTPPGHAILAWAIEPLSGGEVAIRGLSGTPNHLKARKVEVRDSGGTWLVVEGAALDWHLLSALGSHLRIERIAADKVVVVRREIPSQTTSTSTTIIDIGAIDLPRVEVASSVLGRRAALSASGKLYYASRHNVKADLSIRRLDGPGRYEIHAGIVDDIARGTIEIKESGDGLVGGLFGLPDLGPVTIGARAGARGSANDVHFDLGAGLLDVSGGGVLDLKASSADIDFSVVAPAMTPSKTLSWGMISARGHMHGPFAKPDIDARMKIADLKASGTRLAALEAILTGTGGKANLQGTVVGLILPGEKSGAFASEPVVVNAEADLAAPDRPVRLTLAHPLLKASARATTRTPMTGWLRLEAPSLKGLAGLTGLAIEGRATLAADFRRTATDTEIKADGTVAARGDSVPARLLGNAKFSADATMNANVLALKATLAAAAIKADVHGTSGTQQSFVADIAFSDLSRLAPTLIGTLNLRASLSGPAGNGTLSMEGSARAATKGMAKQAVTFSAHAEGLPDLKSARIRASGRFDGSPVSVRTDIAQTKAKQWKVDIADASWRSAHARGSLVIAGTTPQGAVALRVQRLADFAPLVGTALTGSLDARTEFRGNTAAVRASVAGLSAGGATFERVDLGGNVANPFGSPVLSLTLTAPRFSTDAASGSASVRVSGPMDALAIAANTDVTTTDGQSFTVAVNASANTKAQHVTVSRFEGVWRDQTVTLAAPATIDYADGLKFAATFVEGKAMQLTVGGTIPSKGSMNVRANGTADLGVILSGLASVGQNVRGKIVLNVAVTGTSSKPNVVGQATLTGGKIQDYTRGLNLTDIEAVADAQGSAIRLTKFTAKAGPGTVNGSGTVDLAAKGMPVDIAFKASNARPITSDLFTANLDSDLKLQGHLSDGMTLSGTLRILNGNINIPEKFPQEVATLNVRRSRSSGPPAPPPKTTRITLDLTLRSPGQIFVRGRGLEAEFQGALKIGGTTGAPQVLGALEMRRGTFSLAGANLTFTSGTISFNGQALRSRIDPGLDLVAQQESGGITATLKITGTASQPKIALSSTPSMPQDEILAQLLFQQSSKSLSAMQLASVAQAAATLSGGGGGIDPVGTIRKSLGLDRLAVGSNSQSGASGLGATSIEAGKYVLRNVYIGAQQDLSGGTKATVQVDLTRHLKVQAQVNTGPRAANTTSTPLRDQGDSIGLSYQFEY